jgi:tight adherence protein B
VLATLVVGRIVAGVVSGLVGLVGWVALPAIWILGSRFAFNTMLNRRRTQLYSQFPDCLSMIVRSVRAGVPLTEAIRVVAKEAPAPSDAEFSRVAGDLSIGVPIAESLKSMADRNDITEFRFFATALALQSQTGGRLGETLENLGSLIRKRMAVKARGKALSSEARTTALILGCLPMVAGGMLFIVNRAYVNVLFFDPSGQMVLAAAGIMLGIGAFTMKAIIDKALA